MADPSNPRFFKEPVPSRGVPIPVQSGISRIVADNPSVMTHHGTNTYLIAGDDGFVVIDPGPDDAKHVADIMRITAGRISRILLTHTHHDHMGAVAALKADSGAPTYGYMRSADEAFAADHPLNDGDVVGDLTAVFTPGHAQDHLCFARSDGTFVQRRPCHGLVEHDREPAQGKHARLLREPAPPPGAKGQAIPPGTRSRDRGADVVRARSACFTASCGKARSSARYAMARTQRPSS